MKLFYKQSYETSLKELKQISHSIRKECTDHKFNQRESQTTLLLLEELGVCLTHGNLEEKFDVVFEKRWGNYYLNVSHADTDYVNPLDLINEYNEEDVEESSRHAIFSAYKQNLTFTRKGNVNRVSYKIHESGNKVVYYTFAAMLLGVLNGLLIKQVFSESVASTLSTNVFDIIPTLFLNALKMMLAPLVFCSIETSISGLSDVSKFGKMAAKIIGMYLITSIISMLLGYGLGEVFFKGGVGFTINATEATVVTSSTAETIRNTILGVIPSDLVTPIVNGDMMQVIFVGVLVGICANSLGDRIKPFNDFVNSVNTLCTKIITVIMKFLPISCFCSMTTNIINTGIGSLISMFKLVAVIYLSCIVILILYIIMVVIFGRVNPVPFIKKVLPYLLTPFALCSSAACVPMTVDTCTNKLGIDKKLTYFSIPLGATINMNGSCACLVLLTYLFSVAAGIQMNAGMWLNVFITILLLAIGSPGVPGGLVITGSTIFSVVGIPTSAITLVMGINQFIDMCTTATNIFGDIASTTIVASVDNCLDKQIYNQ